METTKQKKRSLRLTLLLLLLTAILLIMSSYAWFTANQTVKVDSLQVNVAAQNGLQISADGVNWSAMINAEDLLNASNASQNRITNQIPANLVPVSTIGAIDSTTGFMDMYLGEVEANETTGKDELTTTKSTEVRGTEGDFIAFDMFLKVEAPTRIALTANSNVKADGTEGIERAARIAFIVSGNEPTGTDYTIIQNMKAQNADGRYIWEPNYNLHTNAAIAHASSTYGIVTTANASRIAYDGVKAETKDEADEPFSILLADTNKEKSPDYFDTVNIAYETAAEFGVGEDHKNDQLEIFSLAKGITKVRVYMWIEGQDVDCENTASGADVTFNIQLTKINETVVP